MWTWIGAVTAVAGAAGALFRWWQNRERRKRDEEQRQAGRDDVARATLEAEAAARQRMQEELANAPDNDKALLDRLRSGEPL